MRAILCCLLISMFHAGAHAETALLEVRPNISARAEYLAGQHARPAVLLLHGFLQTHDFSTVASLARGLHDAGYTVLSPSLSLGIPGRKHSLSCEALHPHTLDDDIREISRWIDWLKSRGHRSIVLVGHSFGSLHLLAYLAHKPDPAVKAFIGASLVEAQIGNTPRAVLIANLESRVKKNQRALVVQTLSFCRKYLSPPEGLLSYVRWDQARLLDALKQSPVSVQLIMGDADKMLENNWILTLKQTHTPMVVVPGANHFMDGAHEFDLLEHTLKYLDPVPKAPSR